MTLLHALLLGVLQGLTEFLPVSSSGHLALAQMLIPGFEQPGVVFDALLHVGTAAAVLAFERRELVRWAVSPDGRRLMALLVLGTAATAAVAFPLRAVASAAFDKPYWVGIGLLVTTLVVFSARRLPGGQRDERTSSWRQAVAVGVMQGVAVFPGISRSGMTIATGLASGMERAWAARFSFLLGVPAILGVAAVEVWGQREAIAVAGGGFWGPALVGAVAAAASGFVALRIVLRTLASHHFHRFAWYTLPLAAAVLLGARLGWL
jgi:undecaprenyl-diphosphatase